MAVIFSAFVFDICSSLKSMIDRQLRLLLSLSSYFPENRIVFEEENQSDYLALNNQSIIRKTRLPKHIKLLEIDQSDLLLLKCTSNHHQDKEMDVPEVSKKLLGELEEMGFPLARAMRALHNSGNSSLEDAISWIVDHEDDPEIDQMPLVPLNIEIEGLESSFVSEEVKLKAQKLRDKAHRRIKEEDKKLEPSGEKERIRAGKELQEAKRIAEENERLRFVALRKAEKEEENRARERIRQKLNQDKAERRRKLGLPQHSHASLKTTAPMVQENKEMLPVVSNIDSTRKIDLMRDCLRSLRRNNKDNDIKVKRAFETLLIYVSNVARDPHEDKFRKIRLNNPIFKERVGIFEQGINFLELCGFERVEGGNYLFLPVGRFDMAVFKSAANVLQSAITNPFFGLLSKEFIIM